MSIYRVVTRVVPLMDNKTSSEPYDFSQLSNNIKEIKIEHLNDPLTGINYRIERIELFEEITQGDTEETMNKAFMEKLNKLGGFLPLTGNVVLPGEINFEVSVPKLLKIDASQHKDSNVKKSEVKMHKEKKSKNLSQLHFKNIIKAKCSGLKKKQLKTPELKNENKKKCDIKNIERSSGGSNVIKHIDDTLYYNKQATVDEKFYQGSGQEAVGGNDQKSVEDIFDIQFTNLLINEPGTINLFTSDDYNDKSSS